MSEATSAEHLTHGMNCPALTPGNDEECTCGLRWRIELQTEQTMHAAWRKRIVHGLLERGGEVRAKVVESTEAQELQGEVRANVAKGSVVYTDAHRAYQGLHDAYVHDFIDHTVEYVRDNIHTNGLENFWALFKRMLKGTYVQVAPFHLQRYVDEEAFRFNARKGDDSDRFASVMGRVAGRRLTYRVLAGIDGAGFMGLE